jgi:uncharacterized protein YoxC
MDDNSEGHMICAICGKTDGEFHKINGKYYCSEHVADAPKSSLHAGAGKKEEPSAATDAPASVNDRFAPDSEKLNAYKDMKAGEKAKPEPVSGRRALTLKAAVPEPEQEFVEGEVVEEKKDSFDDGKKQKYLIAALAFLAVLGWILFFIWTGKGTQLAEKEEQVATLTSNLAKANNLRDGLNSQISTLQTNLQGKEDQLTAANSQIDTLQSEISSLNSSLSSYQCSGVSISSFDFSSKSAMLSSLENYVTKNGEYIEKNDYDLIFSNAEVTDYKVYTNKYLYEFVVFFPDGMFSKKIMDIDHSCMIN